MQKRQDPRRVSPAEVCLGLAKATAVIRSVDVAGGWMPSSQWCGKIDLMPHSLWGSVILGKTNGGIKRKRLPPMGWV